MNTQVKKAIVLAAGTGNRLYPLTESNPKPLTRVGEHSIIKRLVSNLISVGITNIVVVTGHLGEQISVELNEHFSEINFSFIHNERYNATNNIYSLWLAREHFTEDFLLLEADVIFSPETLDQLTFGPADSCACLVSPKEYYMDGACVKLTGAPLRVTAPEQVPIAKQSPDHYKTVNFYRLSSKFANTWLHDRLQQKVANNDLSGYYETLFSQAITENSEPFLACIVNQNDWFEIDNLDDLDIASFRLKDPRQRQSHLEAQHGGYWRYPITDHCLLYNFHYPPRKLLDHLSARLEKLVREYPSSQRPIAEYLSGYYDLKASSLVVSNGVSELIPLLFRDVQKPVLIPTPSFNEYESAVPVGLLRHFALQPENDFYLDPHNLLHQAQAENVGHIVLISPNNPTGNAIPHDDLHTLILGAAKQNIQVILDESFIDFHPESRSASFFPELARYANLTIVLSLSKSHGIGGIRLGMLASGSDSLAAAIRSRLPIWNINSFAEEYLRLFSAFRKEYAASCDKVRYEVQKLRQNLNTLPGLTAFPTDANFLFCRLDERLCTASELVTELLQQEQIFVKDCAGKTLPGAEQYFRISSRNEAQNNQLFLALSRILQTRQACAVRTPELVNAATL